MHTSGGNRATRRWAPILCAVTLLATARALPEEIRVFYDYVENGELRGGRFIVDPTDAEQRTMFGLDPMAPRATGVWPVETVIDNGPTDNRVDLVLLGDGYTDAELGLYATNVQTVVSQFFVDEPFAAYESYFNVHRVDVSSLESGVDEIDLGIFKDTALDMAYGCFGIDRLLCINVSKALNAAASAPDVDQILALANSTRYGGAGYPDNDLGTLAGRNSSAVEVALHEFGHAFADLADEYDYGGPVVYTGPEPVDANVSIYEAATMLAQQRKWFRWLDLAHVDTFEGAAYSRQGIYRPTFNSKMRSLNRPFEEVNVEQFVISTYRIVSPIDDATPASPQPLSSCTTFYVVPLEPLDHSLDVQWAIDGGDVPGATDVVFEIDPATLSPGIHTVSVTVVDGTPRVRDESARATWMTESRQWQIDVLGIPNECLCPPPAALDPEPGSIEKNRYVAFAIPDPLPGDDGLHALRLRAVDLPDFPDANGRTWWVGPPVEVTEGDGDPATFWTAPLQCDPFFGDWTQVDALYVTDAAIVPRSTYAIQRVADCCPSLDDESCYATSLALTTAKWGDAVEPFGGESQPNFGDISAVVDRFRAIPGAVSRTRTDLAPDLLNATVNFEDISAGVDAFRGLVYLFAGPAACP